MYSSFSSEELQMMSVAHVGILVKMSWSSTRAFHVHRSLTFWECLKNLSFHYANWQLSVIVTYTSSSCSSVKLVQCSASAFRQRSSHCEGRLFLPFNEKIASAVHKLELFNLAPFSGCLKHRMMQTHSCMSPVWVAWAVVDKHILNIGYPSKSSSKGYDVLYRGSLTTVKSVWYRPEFTVHLDHMGCVKRARLWDPNSGVQIRNSAWGTSVATEKKQNLW